MTSTAAVQRYLRRPWVATGVIAFLALLVRLWTIHAYSSPYTGGEDLSIYVYWGHLAAAGVDPYTAPGNGLVPAYSGNNQPLELLLFGGLLKLHNSRETLRLFFALVESGTIALIGLTFTDRSMRWRIAVMTLLAFNPFVLLAWTANAEDKSISILLLTLAILFVRREQLVWAWIAAALLLMLKFEGLFIALPLLIATWKRHGRWPALGAACAFAACLIAAEAPFFPHSLIAFQRRSAGIDFPPNHASWTILLNRIGLYDHLWIRPLIVAALLAVAGAYLKRWIRLDQAIALSFFFAFFFLPDEAVTRIALISIPLLLTMSLTWLRLVAIWISSIVSAIAILAAQLPYLPLNHLPFQHLSSSLFVQARAVPSVVIRAVGAYASVPYVAFTNLLLLTVVLCYATDLWQQAQAPDSLSPVGEATRTV